MSENINEYLNKKYQHIQKYLIFSTDNILISIKTVEF